MNPRLCFLIAGVQKGGTTALARYLSAHPGIALPQGKEAHVFDAPDFDPAWTPAQIDARLEPNYAPATASSITGDATPITIFHPRLIERVHHYNPAMRWIVLLRDPVERAISHYFMERGRGAESLPLLLALLAEPWRLRGHEHDFSEASPLRRWSYVARGRYVRQLDALREHFPAEQVLLLRSIDLAVAPQATLERVLGFLGLPPLPATVGVERHFEGGYRPPGPWSPARWLLRWRLRHESVLLQQRYGLVLPAGQL